MIRPTRTAYLAAVASLSLVLAACGSETDDPADTPASSPTQTAAETTTDEEPDVTDDDRITPIPAPAPGDESLPTGQVDDAVLEREDVQEAIAAEAERQDVDEDEVTVAGFAEVTWSDGSIGCPEPGMMYTQALVPGYQLILEVDGQLASYHAAKDKPFSYCADPMAPAPGGVGGSSDY